MSDILSHLNESQRKAVEHTNGPVMVIAGAGSGKTRVLTYRVAMLLEKGVDPFNILALTFTNKAAREMKERILTIAGNSEARNVWMGTFHSIFARILRIDGHLLGYPSHFTIYDTDDSKSLLKAIVRELNLDPKVYQASSLLSRISACKSNLISAGDYNRNEELTEYDRTSGRPFTGTIFTKYADRCFKASAMDFDDLLYFTNILLRDFPEILFKYQQKFKYILVDEYQDTNFAQYLIVKQLAAKHENICVVGDDAQSIYGFRGANIQNILNFQKDYPEAVAYKLEQNYRSTKVIVNAANSIIANNKTQLQKTIWTDNDEGTLITLLRASSDNEEGTLVAQSVFENKMNLQLSNSQFAILYRTNAQSRAIEEAFRKMNIPYRIYGGLSFYKRKEIKDLLAYFRLVINPNDEEALNRIINYPARGIGKTTMEKIVVLSGEKGKNPWQIVENQQCLEPVLNLGTLHKISDFVTMINSFRMQLLNKNAYELARHIALSSGLMKELQEDATPEGINRTENIEELLNAIKDFSEKESETVFENPEAPPPSIRTLDEFMSEIALLTDADEEDDDDTEKVSLMTIHQSKGLEFPYVYIVGLEENLFPSLQSLSSRADLEEERRLFYVALTRAERKVTLAYAESRYRWGNLTLCEPSRFIEEIDPRYLDLPKKISTPKNLFYDDDFVKPGSALSGFKPKNFTKVSEISNKSPKAAISTTEASDPALIQPGMEVLHQSFGQGKVINVEGSEGNRKATVFFPGVGQKQLLLKFARLKIVNSA
ncbi:MAG: UvrD-helicase domain-containing protein [Lentimicrobiaceae bacterium]|nr:UvrD-helicase domain-containing protein [Lentimicrobiaceae bacterium]